MNIIFGKDEADKLTEKYIVLELDTIAIKSNPPFTAYCVVENIPLEQLAGAEPYIKLHSNMMEEYRKRNWMYVENAIEELVGQWNSELDSFYTDILDRVNQYKVEEPPEDWTGIITKN